MWTVEGCSEKVARLEEAYGEQGAGCQAITIFEEKILSEMEVAPRYDCLYC